MKKLLLILLLPFAVLIGSCHHNHSSVGNTTTITNVHAPTSPSDSIKFTADTSHLSLLIFCPLGGTNHVVVHDMTSGNDVFNGDVTTSSQSIASLIPGDTYAVICFSGPGSSSNFVHVTSSFRNSGSTPSPFAGYSQYYNTTGTIGPNDGVVIILEEMQ